MDPTPCPLCGADLPEGEPLRCPNCGLHAAGNLDRPGYRQLAAGLAGVYLLTALLVLLTRGR